MHPHILIVLLGHDLISRVHTLMRRIGHGELVVELQRWSRKVLEAAAKIRWDSQLALSDCLNVEGTPLPFSEKQRSECGKQYAEEPDGHEIIADREQQVGPPRLTGCFASLRPRYLRRKLHEEFPREIWKTAFCSDYRRLVIQNHFHKCTKSCFKKILDQFSAFFCFDRKFLS